MTTPPWCREKVLVYYYLCVYYILDYLLRVLLFSGERRFQRYNFYVLIHSHDFIMNYDAF